MATRLRPQTFTPVDAAWLGFEMPASSTLIAGLLLFDEPLDFAAVRGQVAERLLRFDRFRQYPKSPALPFTLPVWTPAPDFNLDAHVHCTTLPEPGGWPQLKAFVEDLLAWPLPHDRPQWQFHFIERYAAGSALVVCYSHIIADGFASMHLLTALTDPAAAAPALPPAAAPPPNDTSSLAGRLAAALDTLDDIRRLPGALLAAGANLVRDPSRAVGGVDYGLQMGEALARYVLQWPDARTLLRGEPSHSKRVAATEPIPLAEIKAVGKKFGATVNDILASAVAGAFRRYLAGRGSRVEGLTLHAVLPVNLRPPERSSELGNGFSITFMPLPLGDADAVERLQKVKAGASSIKAHPEAPMSFLVTSGLGFLPPPLSRLAARFFIDKLSAVLTNVPGLPEPRYLAGRRLERVMFWVPTPLRLTLGVSILSYAGQVTVCFNSDAQAVPDIEALVDAFCAEYAELRERSQVVDGELAGQTRSR